MATLARQRRFAWITAFFFFAGSVLSFVDQAVLGVLMPHVHKELFAPDGQLELLKFIAT